MNGNSDFCVPVTIIMYMYKYDIQKYVSPGQKNKYDK